MFNWIGKEVIEMTWVDEIAKSFCIVVALVMIGLLGHLVSKLEDKYDKRKR